MMNEKGGMNNMLKYMMMSEMMKGNSNTNSMMPMMLMMNGGFNFDGIFDMDDEEKKEDK
jgi:hypothetical protein